MLRLRAMRFLLVSLVISIFKGSAESTEPKQALLQESEYACTHPAYKIHVFSVSPLVIYISGFITPSERKHLLSITSGTFSNSAVSDSTGFQGLRSTRTSKSTTLPPDPIVDCISQRALRFQGFSSSASHLEPLQLVQYSLNQSYTYHTDWFPSPSEQTTPRFGGNRASSFFAYISASEDLLGGGTNFPILDAPVGDEWCNFVNCDEEWENGVTFRPLEGNAVFWVNLREDGSGDERTLHKGVKVERGAKVGMNIWTREGPLNPELRGL